MILISHRGNISGRIVEAENRPDYIEHAIICGYDVEVDVWFIEGSLWLGHDQPQYKIEQGWFDHRADKLWIHCKNVGAVEWFNTMDGFNYFWHQEDTLTLTSKNFIWAYPGKQPIKSSIAVMPEFYNEDVSNCLGVCSDIIRIYKNI